MIVIKGRCKVIMLVTGRCNVVGMIMGRCYSVIAVSLHRMKHLTLMALLCGTCTLSCYPSAAFFQHHYTNLKSSHYHQYHRLKISHS